MAKKGVLMKKQESCSSQKSHKLELHDNPEMAKDAKKGQTSD